MITVPFFPIYCFLALTWGVCSVIRSIKKKTGWKQEFSLLLLFIYLLLVIKVTLTPFRLNLVYPSFDMNLIPLVETIKVLRGGRLTTALYNIGGNILMLVPFGFLIARAYSNVRKWNIILLYSFGFSLCIELLQFASTTRIFDVDDIVLNTLGGVLGYACFRIVCRKASLNYPQNGKLQKPSFRGITIGILAFAVSFSCAFAFDYQSQTLSSEDIATAYAEQKKAQLIMRDAGHYHYVLVQRDNDLGLELYGKIPLGRYVSVAQSDPVKLSDTSPVAGDLNYQISYQVLDKVGSRYLKQTAPYAVFGYIPDTISGGEVWFDGTSYEIRHDKQYFLSIIEDDVPFGEEKAHVTMKIQSEDGKQWVPKFSNP